MAKRSGGPRAPRAPGDERTDARERALILLYEAESKGITPNEAFANQVVMPDELTEALVGGVESNRERIDQAISKHAKGWTLARMPKLDVMVMRIAGFELLGRPEVPVAVVLNEAVELAKRFSTDDSGRFVNGVLSAMVPTLRGTSGAPTRSKPPRPAPEPEQIATSADVDVQDTDDTSPS